MQQRFDFAYPDLARWRAALQPLLLRVELPPGRSPVGALVKSLISSRTLDAVSLAAYNHLCDWFPSPARLARATPAAIQRVIAQVTFAEAKADHLAKSMTRIEQEQPAFDLAFLGEIPLEDALAWLEQLPGVARKVAAATLNGSRLRRPVFIVDTHVQRVMQRLAFVAPHAEIRTISEQVTAAAPRWSGEDFLRFHVATKRLGQLFCRPDAPDCAHCSLSFDCPSAGCV